MSGGSVKKAKTHRRVSFGGGVEKWGGPGRKGGGEEGKPSPLKMFNTRRGSANFELKRPAGAFWVEKTAF